MHPLESLKESELSNLVRAAEHLLNTQHLLTPGHKTNRLRTGTGIEFLDHREFVPGDDIRYVDWRTTARSRHPQIRRYCEDASADWFIVLDCSASMSIGNSNKWALSLQCAAAMAYLLLHLGNRVCIMQFSNRIEQMLPLGRGYKHYANILQTLRRSNPNTSGGGSRLSSCISRIKRHSPVFVISDFLVPDAMMEALHALTIRGDRLHALQILSNLDYAVPENINIRLKDIETGQAINASPDTLESEHFRNRLDSFCDSLAANCQSLQIRFSRHLDNETWKSVLVRHLREGSGSS